MVLDHLKILLTVKYEHNAFLEYVVILALDITLQLILN